MPNYAVRVELRGNPTYQEYETLHALMARLGFARTIDGVDGNNNKAKFNLPHAVYYGFSAANVSTVRQRVVEEVKAQVQGNIIVFAVQAENWSIGW